MRKIHTKNYADLEKAINRQLRKIDRNYGIRNLYQMPHGRYRFEMKITVDPTDEAKLHEIVRSVLRELPGDRPVQAKYYLPESIVERVKAKAQKKGVSLSALVTECLAESL